MNSFFVLVHRSSQWACLLFSVQWEENLCEIAFVDTLDKGVAPADLGFGIRSLGTSGTALPGMLWSLLAVTDLLRDPPLNLIVCV